MKKALYLFVLCPIIGSACTPTREITYETKDISSLNDSLHTDTSISVMPFDDRRRSVDDTDFLFDNKRISKVEDQKVCINSEKHYVSEEIPLQVATVLQEHLKATGAFKDVYLNAGTGQYKLTGDIIRLSGKQEFSNKAAVGAQFGLIGALATSGVKTDGIIRITLTNLLLVNPETGNTHQLEDIDLQFEGEYKADAYCWSIYNHVNDKLKQAVDERLLPNIIKAIKSNS